MMSKSWSGAEAGVLGGALPGEQVELARIGARGFFGGGKRKLEAEALRQPLAGLGRKTFEVVVHESPNASRFAEVPLDLESPAFKRGFAFPEQLAVAMEMLAVGIVFRRVITQEPQVNEVGRVRKKLKGGEVAFVERARVGPDPADAMFFEEADVLRAMPARMAELDGEPEIAR